MRTLRGGGKKRLLKGAGVGVRPAVALASANVDVDAAVATPPSDLRAGPSRAKNKSVYAGFGSIVVDVDDEVVSADPDEVVDADDADGLDGFDGFGGKDNVPGVLDATAAEVPVQVQVPVGTNGVNTVNTINNSNTNGNHNDEFELEGFGNGSYAATAEPDAHTAFVAEEVAAVAEAVPAIAAPAQDATRGMLPPDSAPDDRINARIVRAASVGDGSAAGITFANAASPDVPITIGLVDTASPFYGQLNVGEVVLAINGTCMIGGSMHDATTAVAAAAASAVPEMKMSVATYFTPTKVSVGPASRKTSATTLTYSN